MVDAMPSLVTIRFIVQFRPIFAYVLIVVGLCRVGVVTTGAILSSLHLLFTVKGWLESLWY